MSVIGALGNVDFVVLFKVDALVLAKVGSFLGVTVAAVSNLFVVAIDDGCFVVMLITVGRFKGSITRKNKIAIGVGIHFK